MTENAAAAAPTQPLSLHTPMAIMSPNTRPPSCELVRALACRAAKSYPKAARVDGPGVAQNTTLSPSVDFEAAERSVALMVSPSTNPPPVRPSDTD